MATNYIVNIFGAMATGKTTLSDSLHNYIDRSYLVDFDAVKKQISGYDSKRDRELATNLTYELLGAVAHSELPTITLLPPPKDEDTYNLLEAIAQKTHRKILNIQLITPLDVLEKRYPEWLRAHEALQEAGTKVKLRTLNEFLDAVKTPYFVPHDTHTFDTSLTSANEVFEQVRQLLSR